MRHRRFPARTLLVALVGVALLSTGCGSNRSQAELRAGALQNASANPGSAPAPSAAPADPATPALSIPTPGSVAPEPGPSSAPPTVSAPGKGGTGLASSPARRSTGGAAASTNKPAAGGPAGASASAGGGSSAKGTPGAPGSPGTPGQPVPGASAAAKAPVLIASIGTDSGVLGEILAPVLHGAKAWVADVNARGGLNGHPVRLVFADDSGEPAKALALARRFVEQDGAIALFMEHGPGTFQAIAPYVEEKKIPVIGSSNSNVASARSPMTFVVGPAAEFGLVWTQILPLLEYEPDKRKVSILYCRESPSCKAGRDILVGFSQRIGIQVVHEGQVGLTQPDFTAEMLAARNAGAEAIVPFVDNNTVIRMARSAARQNYRPVFSAQYASHDERFLKNGGADIDGVLVGASMPHWTSPKLNDYRAAMQRYVPGGILASYGELAWGAGKLLEAVAKGFSATPTSAEILRGLYGLRGETLGGLVPPLTYIEGKGSDANNHCTVALRVDGGKFVAKRGDEFSCEPGWKPTQK